MSERTLPRSSLRHSLAAVLALGLAVNTVWAAGLGRLTVRSALGQPLRAEVEIASLTRDEAATINARLASPEAFRQAGLELSPALASLRFSIDRRGDGRAVVVVTSTQPVSEPFVDLVIELSWANGRFVRGYTFLLDPPELRAGRREVVDGGAVQPVQTPATTGAATGPDAPGVSSSGASRGAPREARTAPLHSAGDRVPVGAGVTLRSIASRIRPEGVTLEQAQVALYRANPSAFLGSIHSLRADATLVVPDRAAMLAVDPAQARAEALGAASTASPERTRPAVESPRAVPPPPPAQPGDGAVGSKPEDRKASSRDRLKLSGPQTLAPSRPAAGEPTSTTASERAPVREGQLGDFQSRITEIERSISEMQRLLELKNRQLAELQKQIEEARGAARTASPSSGARTPSSPGQAPSTSPAAGVTAAPSQASTTSATAVPPPAAVAGAVNPANAPALSSRPDVPPLPTGSGGPPSEGASPPAPPSQAKPETPAPTVSAAKPSAVAPAAAPVPPAQAGFLSELLDQPFTLPGLGAIVLLAVGYGWYAMRRRRKVEHFEDSLVAADGLAANSLFGATGGQSVDTGDGAFGRASGDSSVDIHAAEVDPIAEAEVYIAYGREAQAEEILREALLRQPERQALRAKLLEIHAGRQDVAAFARLAEEMFAATGGRNEEWPRVVAMGAVLDPANPLFSEAGVQRRPEPEVSERLDAILAPPPAAAEAKARPAVPETEPPPPVEPMLEFGPIEMRSGGRQGAELGAKVVTDRPPLSASEPPLSSTRDGVETAAGNPAAVPGAADRPAEPESLGALPAARPVPEMAPLEFAPLDFDLGLSGNKPPDPMVGSASEPAPESAAPAGVDTVAGAEPRIPEPDFSMDFAPLDLPSATSTGTSVGAPTMSGEVEPAAGSLLAPLVESEPSEESAGPPLAFVIPAEGGRGEARPEATARGRTELEKAIDGRFELPSLDLSGVPELPPHAASPSSEEAAPADFSTMRFDLEPAAVIDSPEDARGQDLATRLDLAAAFAEIGDKAGARELLEQVLEEGDTKLRERARAMLGELG